MFGSPARTRTADLVVNSHPLYRLSYRGISRFRIVLTLQGWVNFLFAYFPISIHKCVDFQGIGKSIVSYPKNLRQNA